MDLALIEGRKKELSYDHLFFEKEVILKQIWELSLGHLKHRKHFPHSNFTEL